MLDKRATFIEIVFVGVFLSLSLGWLLSRERFFSCLIGLYCIGRTIVGWYIVVSLIEIPGRKHYAKLSECSSQTALTQLYAKCIGSYLTYSIPVNVKISHLCGVITFFTFSFNWNQFGERISKLTLRLLCAFHIWSTFSSRANCAFLGILQWRYVAWMPFAAVSDWIANFRFLMWGILFIFIFQFLAKKKNVLFPLI